MTQGDSKRSARASGEALARGSREAQGLPPHVEDPEAARVRFDGPIYGSLSVAGAMARRYVIGADQRAQTNGWTFWKYRTADGRERQIDELRRQLWEERRGAE